jgi:hypothetical protein
MENNEIREVSDGVFTRNLDINKDPEKPERIEQIFL